MAGITSDANELLYGLGTITTLSEPHSPAAVLVNANAGTDVEVWACGQHSCHLTQPWQLLKMSTSISQKGKLRLGGVVRKGQIIE